MKIRKTERIITDTHFVCEVCEYSDTDMKKVKACEKSHDCAHDLDTNFDEDDNRFFVKCKKCGAASELDTDDVEEIFKSEMGISCLLGRIGCDLKVHRPWGIK